MMNKKVWWAASGLTCGVYRSLEGATSHLNQFSKSEASLGYAQNCTTAVNQLVTAAKFPKGAEHIYTDGSFHSGQGAWAVYNETTQDIDTGFFKCKTSAEPEIKAIYMALKSIEHRKMQSFVIFTDFLSCFNHAWPPNSPERSTTQDPKEQDSYENLGFAIKALRSSMNLYLVYVPSMSILGNRIADIVAYQTRTTLSNCAVNEAEKVEKGIITVTSCDNLNIPLKTPKNEPAPKNEEAEVSKTVAKKNPAPEPMAQTTATNATNRNMLLLFLFLTTGAMSYVKYG